MNNYKFKKILVNRNVMYSILFVAGVLIGIFFMKTCSTTKEAAKEAVVADAHDHEHEAGQLWTCSMHPQIKMDKPGKCPICGMDLIPLKTSASSGESADPNAIMMSEEAIALANIQTTKIGKSDPKKKLELYGTIEVDERLSKTQTSHISGRIESLSVNFTGELVRQGQTIATVYSPELLNAQKELQEAIKMQQIQPALAQAAREKLRLWKLTDSQIEAIEKSGTVAPLMEIKANTGGVVVTKLVNEGDYVNQGSPLYEVANLSQVWAVFDAYEVDLPFLKVGDNLEFSVRALPGKTFTGKISFIDPMLDPTTRTSKVRVVISNSGMQFKPGMYAVATVNAPIRQAGNDIIIPKSAILWTGERSIVYVKKANAEMPSFLLREVVLGPSLGDSYIILSGLSEGEEIVTNGVFTIDASAQLEGKRSMMNSEVSKPMTGHEGHTMSGESTSHEDHKM